MFSILHASRHTKPAKPLLKPWSLLVALAFSTMLSACNNQAPEQNTGGNKVQLGRHTSNIKLQAWDK